MKPGCVEFDLISYAKEPCSLKADIIRKFSEHQIPFDVFLRQLILIGMPNFLSMYAVCPTKWFYTNKYF